MAQHVTHLLPLIGDLVGQLPALELSAQAILKAQIFGRRPAGPLPNEFTPDADDADQVLGAATYLPRAISPLTINHDSLIGLSGGAVNEHYHLTASQYAAIVTTWSSNILAFAAAQG